MIGQYLPQTNESATVPKIQNFCQLNKALMKNLMILSWFHKCYILLYKFGQTWDALTLQNFGMTYYLW